MAIVAVVLVAGLGLPTAQARAATDRLVAGESLSVSGQLVSPSGAYRAILQADGNFVVYGPTGPTWSTGTRGAGATLVMQVDGNLVMYVAGHSVFSTSTLGSARATVLQDDGNVVVYGSGQALWSSRTGTIPPPVSTVGTTLFSGRILSVNQQLESPDHHYRALVQTDGNFVVYGPSGAVWASRTRTSSPQLTMQIDGNLVMYERGRVLFATRTLGQSPTAVLQDDGNLVVWGSGIPLWSWRTGSLVVGAGGR